MLRWQRNLLVFHVLLTLVYVLSENRVHAQQEGSASEDNVLGNGAQSLSLLQKKLMQDELELSDDQKAKLKELASARRSVTDPTERRKRNTELQESVERVLSSAQLARFKEIAMQAHGISAILDPAVVRTLEITGDQQEQLRAVKSRFGKRMAALTMTDREKQYFALEGEAMREVIELLTQNQRDELEKMKGKPVDVESLLTNKAQKAR